MIASNRTSPYVISGKLRNKYVVVHVFTSLFYNVYDIELIYLDFDLEIGNADIKNPPPILNSHNLRWMFASCWKMLHFWSVKIFLILVLNLDCQGSIVSKISSYQVHAFSSWGIQVPLACINSHLSSLLSSVFIKVLLGGKSFGVGGDGKKLAPSQASRGVWGHAPLVKFWNLGFLECISSILQQKWEFLNRTQTSLSFGFFIQ